MCEGWKKGQEGCEVAPEGSGEHDGRGHPLRGATRRVPKERGCGRAEVKLEVGEDANENEGKEGWREGWRSTAACYDDPQAAPDRSDSAAQPTWRCSFLHGPTRQALSGMRRRKVRTMSQRAAALPATLSLLKRSYVQYLL